jgi:acetamidase/formamidase
VLQATRHVSAVTVNPQRKVIRPPRPFVFAFALGDSGIVADRIIPGETVAIAVSDGKRPPQDPQNWFATRVPTTPPVTGPISVTGVRPGELIEVEVLALEPEDPIRTSCLHVTISVARDVTAHQLGPVQVVIPAGGKVRLPSSHPGGLLSFGPVLADMASNDTEILVSARVTVRCTVVPRQGQ